ncbi:hypothetical protein GJ496_011903 [Pomphorhynchus laevis]|nr:hypothetical protein GJ496_011903 [Pomphorhynchus laevis]
MIQLHIEETNDESTAVKNKAVELGYWKDPYIKYFSKGQVDRPAPEINLGYYLRVVTFRHIQKRFIESFKVSQIVNLGCGFDTTFLYLLDDLDECKLTCTYVELDLDNVVGRKIECIRGHKVIYDKLLKIPSFSSVGGCGDDADKCASNCRRLICKSYKLLACDLSTVSRADFSNLMFSICKLDPSIPTLFISECVLVYLEPNQSQRLLNNIASLFSQAVFLLYEQVNIDDNFGRLMIENFKNKGCPLQGVDVCFSKESQLNRFKDAGFTHVNICTAQELWEKLDRKEVERINSIDRLDEMELLVMLLQHYCFVIAFNFDCQIMSIL